MIKYLISETKCRIFYFLYFKLILYFQYFKRILIKYIKICYKIKNLDAKI